jgi:hypothetical protein
MATSDDAETIRRELAAAVTMTAAELAAALRTEESQSVGRKSGGSEESTGHESGRRIVELLRTRKAELTEDDLARMRKVHGGDSR